MATVTCAGAFLTGGVSRVAIRGRKCLRLGWRSRRRAKPQSGFKVLRWMKKTSGILNDLKNRGVRVFFRTIPEDKPQPLDDILKNSF
ncbi:hypothetical protein KCP78_18970 [Salmonella enterica subsp. enterica]|nr:hypothetical protein KCP78_18970 [Salmonella enterica subsp. enterica]